MPIKAFLHHLSADVPRLIETFLLPASMLLIIVTNFVHVFSKPAQCNVRESKVELILFFIFGFVELRMSAVTSYGSSVGTYFWFRNTKRLGVLTIYRAHPLKISCINIK